MTIRRIGFSSFKISTNDVVIVTDPFITEEAGDKFSSQEADVVLLTENRFANQDTVLEAEGFSKITSKNREDIFEITSPGEYELGGVIIRRKLGTNFYILDENDIRLVYVGAESADIDLDTLKDLGDVDLLITPVGGAAPLASYEQVAKIIAAIDPTRLVPSSYANGIKLADEYKEIKEVKDFIKNAGYTHVSEDKKLKVTKGTEADSKLMEVVILS